MSFKLVLIWFVVYSAGAILISKLYLDDDSRFNVWGPILSYRSRFGITFIKRIAGHFPKLWSYWGILGVILSIITAVLGFVLLSISGYGIFNSPDAVGIQGPTDVLVIPGVNRFLPLSAAPELILGLIIAMLVHEGGHGLYCALGDIKIESTGLIFGGLIPIGAFVEPDEKDQNQADTLDQLKMYAAGIANNYLIFVIMIIILFTMVPILVSPVPGVGVGTVYPDSPAEQADIQRGDIITQANNVSVEEAEDIGNVSDDEELTQVSTNSGETYEIGTGVYAIRAPENSGLNVGRTVVSLDGKSVSSKSEFEEYLESYQDLSVNVTYSDGNESELKVGVFVTAEDDNNFTKSLGIDKKESIIIASIDDAKVNTEEELTQAFNDSKSSHTIRYWRGDDLNQINYTSSEFDNSSLIISPQTSGVSVTRLGIDVYPKDEFYNVFKITGSVGGTLSNIYQSMLLPVLSIVPTASFGFPGFTSFVQNFYNISVGSGLLASAIFFLISTAFWTAWINVNLAIFNSLPTFALDGGHILKAIVRWIPANMDDRTRKYIILAVKVVVLLPVLFLFLGPIYF